VQLLFARLARYIHQNYPEYAIHFIDYEEGYAAKWLRNEGVPFRHLVYKKDSFLSLPSNVIVIMPFDRFSLDTFVAGVKVESCRFLFWFTEPSLLPAVFRVARLSKYTRKEFGKLVAGLVGPIKFKNVGNLLLKSSKNSGLIYMDSENNRFPFYYYPKLKEYSRFLPIPIEAAEHNLTRHMTNDTLHLTWLGRVSDQKVVILKRIMLDLEGMKVEMKSRIHFHIIGDGEADNKLNDFIKRLSFDVTRHGVLEEEELKSFLYEKTTALFAMGTSALEGGILKVPTLLVDLISKVSLSYKYKWLFETQGFTLGQLKTNELNKYTMLEVLELLSNKEKANQIGEKCYSYASQHLMENIGKDFIKICIENSNIITLKELKGAV
jgi:glycosyltransferase involved in cell wall biosynthesis